MYQHYQDYLEYIARVLNFAEPTVRSRRYYLGRFVEEFKEFHQLELRAVDKYLANRLEGGNPDSCNTERAIIRSFLRYCHSYRGIELPFDPVMIRNVKTEKPKVNFVTEEKLMELISSLDGSQDKLILATLFATGMRVGELVRFRVEDFYGTEITVRGKGGKKRLVCIPEYLAKALNQHIRENNIATGSVFRQRVPKLSKPNASYTAQGLRTRLKRLLGGKYVHPHAFRHGLGTTLLRNGADIRAVQTILGHENIQTTMRYTHVTDSHLKESYNKAFKLDVSKMLDITN